MTTTTFPRARTRRAWLPALAVCALALAPACGVNNPTYFPSPMGPIEVGMAGGAAQATVLVALPFRPPSEKEQTALDAESDRLGFAAPWLRRDHVALSLLFSITNLGDEPGTAQVLVDGASEFASYDPQAIRAAQAMLVQNPDEIVVLSLIQPAPVMLKAGQKIEGTVREDDFAEAELDLDAIGRWMAPPPAVLINPSERNRVGLEQMPAEVVVPALVRVAVTFKATRHMRLDFLVRVRDDKGQLQDTPGGDLYAPMPQPYVSMAAAPGYIPRQP